MGRNINTSQPMVLDVMLTPLTESFQINASDTTQQWYYANTNSWSPSRTTNPLILTPVLSVFDTDTEITYTPQFGDVKWYYLSNGAFVQITNTTDGDNVDYIVYPDGHLAVKKNVAWDAPVTLKCVCPYADPRRSGISNTVQATIDLSTNRDATSVLPTVDIACEPTVLYDIFKDVSSQKTFTAKVMKDGEDITSTSSILWYVLNKSNGTETIINATTTVDGTSVTVFPCYVSGYNAATLTLDAMYTEDITVVARVVKTASPLELYPCKAIRTLRWDNIPLSIIVHSNNSGGIRTDTESMDFDIIANIRHQTLTDAQKLANLLINWKRRNAANSTIFDDGWGQALHLKGDTLRAYNSTLVYVEAYLLGAYEVVADDGEVVTDDGEPVYDRSL